MKKNLNKIKIKYDPESDVLSWEISKRPIDYAIEIGNMILHFSSENIPVYIEILEARKFLGKTQKLIKEKVPATIY
ncbi:MAG: DUF2283 domain-containing protein [Patescibacteria group bacterium]|nr:DUF2283 domain-containing protein [Patescibacteria group bacterium]